MLRRRSKPLTVPPGDRRACDDDDMSSPHRAGRRTEAPTLAASSTRAASVRAVPRIRRRLRFKTKLYGAFAILTIIIIAAGVISYFGAARLNHHLERSHLAHEVHESYLSLSSNTYQLFRQLADSILVGNLDHVAGEVLLLGAVRSDLNNIRLLIAEEVRHVGDAENEGDELVALAAIERKVDEIIREYEEINSLRGDGNPVAAEAHFIDLLETRIDRDFNAMIAEAIEEEKREAAEADAAFAIIAHRLEAWTAALVFTAAPTALLMLFLLARDIRRALYELTVGAEAYAQGRLDYRIPDLNDADFDIIGARFNRMASELSASRADMAQSNETLEATVRERTAELETANKQLKETDGARRRLFADISHELRTPLTVIRGEAEIALRGAEKAAGEYRITLARIVDQVGHTTRLVDDLLFIARSEAGKPRIEMGSVALAPLLMSALKNFQTIAEEKRISIRHHIDMTNMTVMGDQGRLRQVFSILLDNAIRYSTPGDEVRVALNHAGDSAIVLIEDDGIGIAEADLAKVFHRFYRGDNAVRHAKGSGLGLPVAKAIVEAHRGHIDLMSQAGEGVTVKVTLPVEGRLRAVS